MRPDPDVRAPASPPTAEQARTRGVSFIGTALDFVTRTRTAVGAAAGWRRRSYAFAAGSLSALAMAPVFFWPVLFLTLPVLVWLIDCNRAHGRRSLLAAAFDGWWFGFGYFFFGLFWIGEAFLVEAEIFAWLLPFAITLMPAGLAIFTALACAASKVFWRQDFSRVLVLAVALAAAEYLRGTIFTGFPWNILGYALTSDEIAMQSAGLFGIYGLTLWTVLICATPLVALATATRASFRLTVIFAGTLLPLFGIYAYGLSVLPSEQLQSVDGVKIRIVQPSVLQHHKWAREKQGEIFADHLLLSRTDEDGRIDDLVGITHVVWPEAAMPFLPLATPQALSAIGELLPERTYLIAGALRLESSQVGDEVRPSIKAKNKVFNSMIVFGPAGEAEAIYDKVHLVPFGEYLPFTETLEAVGLEALTRIRGGFAAGPRPRPLLSVPGLPPMGPLICYEAIFPAAVIQGAERPSVLVNVTNDGWFGNITGPFQHLHQTRLRSVEEGMPVVRVANNGVSALIDPYGRIVKSIGLNVRGVLDVSLPTPGPSTLYSLYGNSIFFATMVLFALAASALMAYPIRPGNF